MVSSFQVCLCLGPQLKPLLWQKSHGNFHPYTFPIAVLGSTLFPGPAVSKVLRFSQAAGCRGLKQPETLTPKAHQAWTCQNCSHAGRCAAMRCQGWPPTDVPRSPRIPALGEGKRRGMTASTTILWFLSPVTVLGMLPTPAPPPHAPGVQGSRAETSPGAPKYWGCTTSAPQKLSGCSDFLGGIFCFSISGTHKQK